MLRLTLLSPEIVETVLNGPQPSGLTFSTLELNFFSFVARSNVKFQHHTATGSKRDALSSAPSPEYGRAALVAELREAALSDVGEEVMVGFGMPEVVDRGGLRSEAC